MRTHKYIFQHIQNSIKEYESTEVTVQSFTHLRG